jgi:response regulator RpfG family c-di-GMP phosphodiesterase
MNWPAVALLAVALILTVVSVVLARALLLEKRRARLMQDATVDLAIATLETRDPEIARHCLRVAELASRLTRQLGRGPQEIELVRIAGALHDLGMIGVPDGVLNQPGTLAAEDWEVMRRHPDVGADLINDHPALAAAAPIVRHHHERWDGSGYPVGLGGTVIPLGARVVAVAESLDTMTNNQLYRASAVTTGDAIREISQHSGSWYDPTVVDALRTLFK